MFALLFGLGCVAPPAPEPPAVDLTRIPVEVVELAPWSRPGDVLPERIPLPLRRSGEVWRSRLPVRGVYYGQRGSRQPPGMAVFDGDVALPFSASGDVVPSWTARNGQVTVRLPPERDGAGITLAPGGIGAQERELDRRSSAAADDLAFVVRDQPVEGDTRRGFYLPAPSRVRVSVVVPPGGVFETRAHLLRPAIGDRGASDGASVTVSIGDALLHHEALEPETEVPIRVDLSRWAGERVELELATDPEGAPDRDHVFLEAPAVFRPSENPRRFVVVMVDTLRADRLGVYGHPVPTSPNLDAWAAEAAVFTEARAPAPWTLPSSQALLSGRHPERWDAGPLAPERFARAGFVTASLSSNMYLGADFGLASGWAHHESYPSQSAPAGLAAATALLERYPDRDLFLFLHFMDPHLPYNEGPEHRDLFAGPAPAGLPDVPQQPDFERAWASADAATRAEIEAWAKARYDQNIHQVDAAFGELLPWLGSDAWVAFVSDHGELFFDDGTYGHGQSLHEGLVRVPFLVRGPGVAPGRWDVPVSLMDLVPTITALVDAEAHALDGRSIAPMLAGEPQPPVDQGLGRILFGDAGWAVVHGGRRYQTRGSSESLISLADGASLDEELGPWRERLGAALGRPLLPVTRFAVDDGAMGIGDAGLSWTAERAGGFGSVWGREDPARALGHPEVSGDAITVRRVRAGVMAPREVFAYAPDGLDGASVRLRVGEGEWSGTVTGGSLVLGEPPRRLVIGRAFQPAPLGVELVQELGQDVRRELEALGYVE